MNYQKVSIPKNGDGAGCATPKSSDIIIMDVDDVKAEPTRVVGNTIMEGDYELNSQATAVVIYATPSSIDLTEEYSGDADARGVKQGVAFEHPGNGLDIKGFTEAYMNRGVIILVKEDDGSSTGHTQAFGSKSNPLFMSVESTNNKDATKRKFTFKQELNSKFLPGDYLGAAVPVADKAKASNQEGA